MKERASISLHKIAHQIAYLQKGTIKNCYADETKLMANRYGMYLHSDDDRQGCSQGRQDSSWPKDLSAEGRYEQ